MKLKVCETQREIGMMFACKKNTPQRPKITDGTAAIRSTREIAKLLILSGRTSEIRRDVPRPSGNETKRAITAMVTVPNKTAAIPNFPFSGVQAVSVRKFHP
jgi:hypothetical protein